MNVLLVILFAITLIYLSITERFRNYASLIGIQGLLLFILAFLELEKITLATLLFVATETLVFKVIVVPYLLLLIIRKTGIERVHEKACQDFIPYCLFRQDYCSASWSPFNAYYPG